MCSRTPVPPLQFFDAALRYVDAIKTLVTLLPALSAATKSEGAAVRKRFPGLPISPARITHERVTAAATRAGRSPSKCELLHIRTAKNVRAPSCQDEG